MAKAEHATHPCNYFHNPRVTPRDHRVTPAGYLTKCLEVVPPCPEDISMARHIHITYASRAIELREPNNILGVPFPQVDPSELELLRSDRVDLSRLRCGHHIGLRYYSHRIGLQRVFSDLCRRCLGAPDTLSHVMGVCPVLHLERETWLFDAERDLWTRPTQAAEFLRAAGLMLLPEDT